NVMPLYEYFCHDCGVFEEIRPLSESGADSVCPLCGLGARRILSAPHLTRVPAHVRQAHETNERSRHEPRVSQKPSCCAQGTCASHGGASRASTSSTRAPSKSAAAPAQPTYKAQ